MGREGEREREFDRQVQHDILRSCAKKLGQNFGAKITILNCAKLILENFLLSTSLLCPNEARKGKENLISRITRMAEG